MKEESRDLIFDNIVKTHREPKQLQANFQAFGEIENEKYNTKISFERNYIEFLTTKGETFSLKLKNNIENIFNLSDGILIKVDYPSEDFHYFKNPLKTTKDLKDTESKKYMYYIINTHPLNTIYIVKNSILNSQMEYNLDKAFNIVKVSNSIPLLLNLRSNGEIDLLCLLYKKFELKNDFGNYITKILNSASAIKINNPFNDNFDMTSPDSSYFFHELISNINLEFTLNFLTKNLREEELLKVVEIKFFKNFSDNLAVYLSIFNRRSKSLFICKIDFPNDSYIEAKISRKIVIQDVMQISYVEDYFSNFSENLFIEKNEIEFELLNRVNVDSSSQNTCSYDDNSNINSNHFLRLFAKEEVKEYKKEKSLRKYENIIILNDKGELILIENMEFIMKINIKEDIKINQNISIQDYKINNFFYDSAKDILILLFEKNELEIFPLRTELAYKINDFLITKILEVLKLIFKYLGKSHLMFQINEDIKNKRISLHEGNIHNDENVLFIVFLRGLNIYLIRRMKEKFRGFHKAINLKEKISNESLLKYFFEFLSFLCFWDLHDFEKLKLIFQEKEKLMNLANMNDNPLYKSSIYLQIIKSENPYFFDNNSTQNKNDNKMLYLKKFYCEFFNFENLNKEAPEILLIKNILDQNKNIKTFFMDFLCQLYESLKLFKFSSYNFNLNECSKNNTNKIFSTFIFSQIKNLGLEDKYRYRDFINFNFDIKLGSKLSQRFILDLNEKKIFNNSDILNMLRLTDYRNNHMNGYRSLIKYLNNFMLHKNKQGLYYYSLFRNVNELLIILYLHYKNSSEIMKEKSTQNSEHCYLTNKKNILTRRNLNINECYGGLSNNKDLNDRSKNFNNNTPSSLIKNNLNFYIPTLINHEINNINEEEIPILTVSPNNIYLSNKRDEILKNNLYNGISSNMKKNNFEYDRYERFCLYSENNLIEDELNQCEAAEKNKENKIIQAENNALEIINLINNNKNFRRIFSFFLNEKKDIFYNSFLVSLISADLTTGNIKEMLPEISFFFLERISNIKINTNSYKILTDNQPEINEKILQMIGRIDMAKNLKSSLVSMTKINNKMKPNNKNKYELSNRNNNVISNMLYQEQTTILEQDYYLAYLKFNLDSRFYEVLRILNPYSAIKINSDFINDLISANNLGGAMPDIAKVEKEKLDISCRNIIKQLSSLYGSGALNLNIIKNFPRDVLNIKPLNKTIVFSHDNSSMKIDFNSENFLNFLSMNNYINYYNFQNFTNNIPNIREKEFLKWPEFHSGVSQAIKLSSDFLNSNNSSYIRNWILFNKPNLNTQNLNCEQQHGGFIFGMGLLKVLDNLLSTDIYQYMKSAHEAITIGIMLGRAVSKISSMEESTSRTLCLHISYLIPPNLDINFPMSVQCAAIFSLGLLYQSTCNRLMTEMLLNQIGKKKNLEKTQNMSLIDSYNLCLGFSIGLINLALGNHAKILNEDLKLEEKLLNFANGGKKFDIINIQNRSFYNYSNTNNYEHPRMIYEMSGNSALGKGQIHNNIIHPSNQRNGNNTLKTGENFIEDIEVNVNLTSICAYAALSLMYLKTNNQNIANKINIPKNLFELNSWKPFNLYLAILSKNMIMWDSIENSDIWINTQIPLFIKFLYENDFETISKNVDFHAKTNNIEFSLISTSYMFCLAAGIMSMGLKFMGTNNKKASKIIIDFIHKMKNVKAIQDIIIKDNIKYFDNNKFFVNKTTLDQSLCIAAYALSMIMAGSGDLDSFRVLRILRKRLDIDTKHSVFGYQQAIHHSIGFLFLGSGSLTFSQTKESIAYLYISTFPIFANHTNDIDKYLQPLRHLYVLACVTKILETRDIDTKKVIKTNIKLIYKDKKEEIVETPVNIDDIYQVDKIILNSNDYYQINISGSDFIIKQGKNERLKNKIIYVKKKFNMSEDFYREIRHLSFGNNDINRDQIISIKNTLKNDLLALKSNQDFYDIKKYITEIILKEINILQYDKIYFDENHFKSKIFRRYQIIKKNLLIFYCEFLYKENLFTLNNILEFFKNLEFIITEYCELDKFDNTMILSLISKWRVIEKNLLNFESKNFKYQYKVGVKEMTNFLIYLCMEVDSFKCYMKNFIKFLITHKIYNNNPDQYFTEEILAMSNDFNYDFDYLLINKFFDIFSNEDNPEIIYDCFFINVIAEFLVIFKTFSDLIGVREEIRMVLSILHNSYKSETLENNKDLSFINQDLANKLTEVWMKSLEYYKSFELLFYIYGILTEILNEIN